MRTENVLTLIKKFVKYCPFKGPWIEICSIKNKFSQLYRTSWYYQSLLFTDAQYSCFKRIL